MIQLRIDFCDVGRGFPKARNFFTEILQTRYDVRLSDEPDFLFYGDYGCHHRVYTCPRIYYTGEPVLPDWRETDYALTYHHLDDPRHLRLPLYVLYASPGRLLNLSYENPGPLPDPPEPAEVSLAAKSKFCAIVVSNIHRSAARKRMEFFEKLSRRAPVDSGGRAFNNIGESIPPGAVFKQRFLRPYKFNICFENRSVPGYTSEKIYEAFLARCIPIYWGDPRVHEEFNPKAFLNYSDFPSEDALIDRIMQIDADPDLHLQYLREPVFAGNKPNPYFDKGRLLDFFDRIFSTPIRPVGSRRRFFQFGRWIPVARNPYHPPGIWESGAKAERPLRSGSV